MITEEYNCEKLESLIRERPVTVIAAMRESDNSILIASDSEVAEGDILRITIGNKLQHHLKGMVAWGAAGNVTIGIEDFGAWLQEYEWPPENWYKFREDAVEKFAKLNGRQRELVSLSGAEAKESDVADFLLAGWLDRPEIYEFHNTGKATSYWKYGFHAIGTGQAQAWIAYKALSLVANINPLEKLQYIMKVVVTSAPQCGYPYYIWRITPEGITKDLEQGD